MIDTGIHKNNPLVFCHFFAQFGGERGGSYGFQSWDVLMKQLTGYYVSYAVITAEGIAITDYQYSFICHRHITIFSPAYSNFMFPLSLSKEDSLIGVILFVVSINLYTGIVR